MEWLREKNSIPTSRMKKFLVVLKGHCNFSKLISSPFGYTWCSDSICILNLCTPVEMFAMILISVLTFVAPESCPFCYLRPGLWLCLSIIPSVFFSAITWRLLRIQFHAQCHSDFAFSLVATMLLGHPSVFTLSLYAL